MKGRAALQWILIVAAVSAVVWIPPADAQIASTQRNLVMGCAFCHSLHGAPGGFLLQNVDTTTLCLTCHDPNAGTAIRVNVHTNEGSSAYDYDPTDPNHLNPDGGQSYWVGCLNCHNPHYKLVNIRGLTSDGNLNDGPGNLLDDPAAEQSNCTDTDGNIEICNNHFQLGAIRDDINGAKILTPGISDTQANCTATGGTPRIENSVYIGCERTLLIGRLEPLAVGSGQSKIVYNDWIRSTPTATGAYIAMCQTCHTRTQHHRNNDGDVWGFGAFDRTHNVERRCTDCHDHRLGFSKNQ